MNRGNKKRLNVWNQAAQSLTQERKVSDKFTRCCLIPKTQAFILVLCVSAPAGCQPCRWILLLSAVEYITVDCVCQ